MTGSEAHWEEYPLFCEQRPLLTMVWGVCDTAGVYDVFTSLIQKLEGLVLR